MSGGMDIRESDPRVGAFPENWGLQQRLGPIQKHPDRWNGLTTVVNLVETLQDGELALSIDCSTEDFFLAVNRELHAKLTARGILAGPDAAPGKHLGRPLPAPAPGMCQTVVPAPVDDAGRTTGELP